MDQGADRRGARRDPAPLSMQALVADDSSIDSSADVSFSPYFSSSSPVVPTTTAAAMAGAQRAVAAAAARHQEASIVPPSVVAREAAHRRLTSGTTSARSRDPSPTATAASGGGDARTTVSSRGPSPKSTSSPTVRFSSGTTKAPLPTTTAAGPSPRSDVAPSVTSAGPSPSFSHGSQTVAAERIVELLRQKDEHITAFQNEVTAYAEELDMMKADKAAAVAQLHQAVRRNEALSVQNEQLQRELRAARDHSSQVTADTRGASAEIGSMRQALDHANRQLEHHRGESVRLTMELRVQRDQVRAANELVDERDRELRALADKLRALQADATNARAHGVAADAEMREHIASIRETTEHAKARLEQALMRESERSLAAERAIANCDAAKAELAATATQLRELQLQNGELKRQLEDAMLNGRESADRAATLEIALAEQKHKLLDAAGIGQSYAAEIGELRRIIAAVTSDATSLRNRGDQLAPELDRVTRDRDECLAQLREEQSTVNDLRMVIQRLTTELDSARATAKSEAKTVLDLRSKVTSLDSCRRQMEDKLSDVCDERAAALEQLKDLDRRHRKVVADCNALRDRLTTEATRSSDILNGQEDLIRRREMEWAQEEARLNQVVDEVTQQLRAANGELAVHRKDADELRASLSVAESRGTAAAAHASTFQSEVARLKALMADAEDNAAQLRVLKSELAAKAAELDGARKVHAACEKQLKDLTATGKASREESRTKIEMLEKQLASTRARLDAREAESQRAVAADASLSAANQQCRNLSEQLQQAQKDLAAARSATDAERAYTASLREGLSDRFKITNQSKAAIAELSASLDAAESALAAAKRESAARGAALSMVAQAAANESMGVLDLVVTRSEATCDPMLRAFDAFVTDFITTLECQGRELASDVMADEAVSRADGGSESGLAVKELTSAAKRCWRDAQTLVNELDAVEMRELSHMSDIVLGYDVVAAVQKWDESQDKMLSALRHAGDTPSVTQAMERRRSIEARRAAHRAFLSVAQKHAAMVITRFAACRPLIDLQLECSGRPAADVAAENRLRIASNDDTARVLRAHLRDGTQRSLLASQLTEHFTAIARRSLAAARISGEGAFRRRAPSETSAHAPFGTSASRFGGVDVTTQSSATTAGARRGSRSRASSTPNRHGLRSPESVALDDTAVNRSEFAADHHASGAADVAAVSMHALVEQHLDALVFIPMRPNPGHM